LVGKWEEEEEEEEEEKGRFGLLLFFAKNESVRVCWSERQP
jgi:hypothetical protein